MGFHVGKYASLSHGSVMGMHGFLWCMSRQQRLDPQLLDAWNGLGEVGDRGKERNRPGSKQQEIPWMTRIPYVRV